MYVSVINILLSLSFFSLHNKIAVSIFPLFNNLTSHLLSAEICFPCWKWNKRQTSGPQAWCVYTSLFLSLPPGPLPTSPSLYSPWLGSALRVSQFTHNSLLLTSLSAAHSPSPLMLHGLYKSDCVERRRGNKRQVVVWRTDSTSSTNDFCQADSHTKRMHFASFFFFKVCSNKIISGLNAENYPSYYYYFCAKLVFSKIEFNIMASHLTFNLETSIYFYAITTIFFYFFYLIS